MNVEIDTTPVYTCTLHELHIALEKATAQIAAFEPHLARLVAASDKAKTAWENSAATYKKSRTVKNMLDAMLLADIATDAVEAVTNAEATLLALRKRHQEMTRANYTRESAGSHNFSPWAVMSPEE